MKKFLLGAFALACLLSIDVATKSAEAGCKDRINKQFAAGELQKRTRRDAIEACRRGEKVDAVKIKQTDGCVKALYASGARRGYGRC